MKNYNETKIDYAIYLVADSSVANLENLLEQALSVGVSVVQYRNKTDNDEIFLAKATKIQKLCKKYQTPFIVNDNLKVAISLKADGLHVGQSDDDIIAIKTQFSGLVGISCQTIDQIKSATINGADYIGLGAIYPSQTKPDAKIVSQEVLLEASFVKNIPIVLIGGMNKNSVTNLIKKYHYQNFAFISYILKSGDIKRSINVIKELLLSN